MTRRISQAREGRYSQLEPLLNTEKMILKDLMQRHFSSLGSWRGANQTADRFAGHVAKTLLNPTPQGRKQATPLVRDFLDRLHSLGVTYGEHNVRQRIALFLIRENAFLAETGTEVIDLVTPEVLSALHKTKIAAQLRKGKISTRTIRLLSYFLDRLRVDILNSGNNFPSALTRFEVDSADPKGSYARSRVFGPEGLEKIPDEQITPLRREDQDVMGRKRPTDPMENENQIDKNYC